MISSSLVSIQHLKFGIGPAKGAKDIPCHYFASIYLSTICLHCYPVFFSIIPTCSAFWGSFVRQKRQKTIPIHRYWQLRCHQLPSAACLQAAGGRCGEAGKNPRCENATRRGRRARDRTPGPSTCEVTVLYTMHAPLCVASMDHLSQFKHTQSNHWVVCKRYVT